MKAESVLSWKRSMLIAGHYLIGYRFIYPRILDFIYLHAELSRFASYRLQTAVYLLVFAVTVIGGWPLIKDGWNKYAGKPEKNMKLIVGAQVFMIFMTVVISLTLQALGFGISRNQRAVNAAMKANPVYYGILAIIYAPFVEETVFRGCIFKRVKASGHLKLAYFLSAFLFGFVHVMDSIIAGIYSDAVFLVMYCGLGAVLTYVCDKTDSVFCSILLHMFNNSLGFLGGR